MGLGIWGNDIALAPILSSTSENPLVSALISFMGIYCGTTALTKGRRDFERRMWIADAWLKKVCLLGIN